MRIVLDLADDLGRPLTDYCVENKVTPEQLLNDLLLSLLGKPSTMVLEDTELVISDLIVAFCQLVDKTPSQEYADEDLSELVTRVRAGLHEIYLEIMAEE